MVGVAACAMADAGPTATTLAATTSAERTKSAGVGRSIESESEACATMGSWVERVVSTIEETGRSVAGAAEPFPAAAVTGVALLATARLPPAVDGAVAAANAEPSSAHPAPAVAVAAGAGVAAVDTCAKGAAGAGVAASAVTSAVAVISAAVAHSLAAASRAAFLLRLRCCEEDNPLGWLWAVASGQAARSAPPASSPPLEDVAELVREGRPALA